MKRKSLTYLLTILMSMVGVNAYAHDIEVANDDGVTIYYNFINDNTELEVSHQGSYYWDNNNNRYNGAVVIPGTVTYNEFTYPVTSIGQGAFYNCSGLTSVTIPNSVTSFGAAAFQNCSSLTSVTIPNSVTSIGEWAFRGCSGLTSVTIPNGVTSIGNNAFTGCSGLTSIVVSSGNAKYDSRGNCNAIIETATNTLILGCKNTVIPNSVTSIGESAFNGCNGLTSITIPNSVTSIGQYAFFGCSGLTMVTLHCQTVGDWFRENTSILTVIIGNEVTSIGEEAFWGCSGLTSVTIPNSVTSIGYSAFRGCSGLTSVTIPNSVTSIGNYVFEGCTGLEKVIVNDIAAWCNISFGVYESNPLYYAHHLYSDENTEITELLIPNSVTSISNKAFSGCSGLTSITIPNNVTSISESVFSGCSGLTSVTIPNSVTSISESVFSGCSGLTSVTIPNSVTSIGQYAFSGCSGLTSITIPNSVTSIGDYSFSQCGLTSVTIPNSVTSIGRDAFSCCNSLSSVKIPNSVTSIATHAFYESNILEVTVEIETPLPIDRYIFTNRANATLYVPEGCVHAYQYAIYWQDFKFIEEIPASAPNIIDFADSNVKTICVTHWDTDGDEELSLDEAAAVTNLGTAFQTNTDITSFDELQYFTGLTSIGQGAFYNCTGLTSVTIPNSVTSIGVCAFQNCSILTSVEIPNNVTSIGDEAFSACTALTSITIPNNVTTIGAEAFYGCSGLTGSLEIPNSVTSIGQRAFGACGGGLTSLAVSSGNTNYDSRGDCNAIIETATNMLILGCNNTEIPNSVTSIGEEAFWGCSGLTSVTIPNGVTSIGDYAFYGCSALTSVEIPNSVTSFGLMGGVFGGCTNLTSIVVSSGNTKYDSRGNCNAIIETATNTLIEGCKNTVIPNSVTRIGIQAFYGCSSLTSVTIPNSVTFIANRAFKNCSGLTSVTVEIETPLTITQDVFSNRANATLYVPDGCVSAYQNTQYWQDFKSIEEIVDNVSITMATGSGSPRTMIGFSSANGLDFRNVSDVKAYIAVGFTASKEVLMTRVNVVPPYTGVVLLTTTPGITVTVSTTDEEVYYANLLKPAVGPTVIYPTETIEGVEYTNLVVGKLSGTDIMGFVKDSAPKTYTNKCYLHIPSSYYNTSASAPLYDGLNMVFDDEETTGITPIDNGEFMMDNVYYDLNGRRVEHPTKGLYIVNGKKVIVK